MWKMYEREKVRARANICVVENEPLYVLQRFDDVILRKNDMEIWAFFLLSLEHLCREMGLHSRVLIIFSLQCDTIFIYRLCWPSVFLLHGRWESGLCARESFPHDVIVFVQHYFSCCGVFSHRNGGDVGRVCFGSVAGMIGIW